jgi:sodium/potassium/calcium exchanger 6
MSDSLSAVTLLAFANGAGDVITALVASGEEGGVSYSIGAIYGAGLFAFTLVVALCIFQNKDKDIVFEKMIIFRDVGVYIIATIIVSLFAFF